MYISERKIQKGDYIVSLEESYYKKKNEIFVVMGMEGNQVKYYPTKGGSGLYTGQIYKSIAREHFRLATPEEIKMYQVNGRGVVVPFHDNNGDIVRIPTSGWCKDFNETILTYLDTLGDNDILRKCESKGKCGFAWKMYSGGWCAWPILQTSSKKVYSKDELLVLVPSSFKKKFTWRMAIPKINPAKKELPIYYGTSGVGKTMIAGVDDYMPIDPESYDNQSPLNQERREYEEHRQRELEGSFHILQHHIQYPHHSYSDRAMASAMAMKAQWLNDKPMGIWEQIKKKEDEFTQQEPVVIESKKKKRKELIVS
jgi:hypothetical protein